MPSSYAIGDHFEQFIKTQLESGRYSSASEIVRDALRLMEEREQLRQIQLEQFRQQIQAGIDSGPSIPAEEVFDRLSAKYQAMAQG
ncbi:MAG: type II toxin-antitoxin system ParD family antitoxin [Proteobacteria bacterium]|nr:type II toxin-antitoxin system ParD family antitoxin [Pseudomonadota bacterium]